MDRPTKVPHSVQGRHAPQRSIDPIESDLGNPNYILDHDMADKAIAWLEMQDAGLREHARKLKQDCGGSQFAA